MKRHSIFFAVAFTTGACSGGVSSGPPGAEPVAPPETAAEAPSPADESADETPKPPELRLGKTVVPIGYQAELTLDPDRETFTGVVEIDVAVNQPTDHLWLHGKKLDVDRATLTRGEQTFDLESIPEDDEDFLGFAIGETVEPGAARVRVSYQGQVNDEDTMEGTFRQKDSDTWYLYTQFEATGARRVFPSFDEPHFKVPWQLTLNVPEDDLALSNTPIAEETPTGDGMRKVEFARTKPLPSYLVAFAVGPFEIVDAGEAGRHDTPVRIIVPEGRTDEAAHATKTTPLLMERLEDYFGMAYPYAKVDHIALPTFFGAMENPGLITYSADILLTEPDDKTATFERSHASIVSHELAHQWFGNLVTLAWWNDIWLNESFASWMGEKIVHQWKPEWEGQVGALAGRDRAMDADALVSARKIRQPIESKHDIARAFDAITYQKGGAMLAMFERWIGEEAFQKGVRDYMEKYAWKTADASDFLAAIGAASRPEVPEAFKTFLDQPGVPLLEVEVACDGDGPPALEIEQERFLPTGSQGQTGGQAWHIPVCVKYGTGRAAHESCQLVTESRATIELAEAETCPTWVLPNAGGVGYYRTAYPDEMLEHIFSRGRRHLTIADRVGVIGDMSALVSTGRVGIGESLALVPTLLENRNDHIVREAAQIVAGVDDNILPEKLESSYARFVRKMFRRKARRLGWQPDDEESETTTMMRPLIVGLVARRGGDRKLANEARRLTDRWLETREGIAPSMVGTVLGTAAYYGDEKLYDRFVTALEEADDRKERSRILGAMTSFRGTEFAERNLQRFLDDDSELGLRESFALLQGPLGHRETREMAYGFIKDNIDTISERLPMMAKSYIIYVSAAFCDREHLEGAKKFWNERVDDIPGGPKVLEQVLERIQLCIAFKEEQQPKLVEFLRRY